MGTGTSAPPSTPGVTVSDPVPTPDDRAPVEPDAPVVAADAPAGLITLGAADVEVCTDDSCLPEL